MMQRAAYWSMERISAIVKCYIVWDVTIIVLTVDQGNVASSVDVNVNGYTKQKLR